MDNPVYFQSEAHNETAYMNAIKYKMKNLALCPTILERQIKR